MQVDFRLPSLGADMESALLTEWLKKPGEPVRRGEALATVETAKGLIDIESYDEGTVAEIVVQPGTKVSVGAVLARLSVAGAPQMPALPAAASVSAPSAPLLQPTPESLEISGPQRISVSAPSAPAPSAPASPAAATRISPAARRRAQELGVKLEALEQFALGKVIHIEDVERLARLASTSVPVDARAAMRAAIGAAMARSKREIPHYYLAQAVDFGPAQAWLAQCNARLPVKERLIEAVLITKAVALAAARLEGFSGHFREGRFEPAVPVHAGVAISVRGGGLVAPALLEADRKDLATLMREFSALVTRVRAGHMRSSEFAAATITVTSLGADGADVLYPIINPPQVAIVGAGAIRLSPWVQNGQIVVRPVLTLTLGADHRVTDGRAGSRFLQTAAELLAHPETL